MAETPTSSRPLADAEHSHVLARVVDDLVRRHHGVLDASDVEEVVRDSYARLAGTARVRTYLPVLARHFAGQRLADLVRSLGRSTRSVPQVVFVCVHNAGRSQLAAALLEHHALGRVDVRSAGSDPSGELNPAVVAALAEVGIALDVAYPKPITDEVVRAADVVVTMGCGDACPVLPGTRYLEWDLPDPAGMPLAGVRTLRDETDRRVRALLAELTG